MDDEHVMNLIKENDKDIFGGIQKRNYLLEMIDDGQLKSFSLSNDRFLRLFWISGAVYHFDLKAYEVEDGWTYSKDYLLDLMQWMRESGYKAKGLVKEDLISEIKTISDIDVKFKFYLAKPGWYRVLEIKIKNQEIITVKNS